jgi:hypothetical protein
LELILAERDGTPLAMIAASVSVWLDQLNLYMTL